MVKARASRGVESGEGRPMGFGVPVPALFSFSSLCCTPANPAFSLQTM